MFRFFLSDLDGEMHARIRYYLRLSEYHFNEIFRYNNGAAGENCFNSIEIGATQFISLSFAFVSNDHSIL